jgi:apolipoprotein N-acyltransferase
MRWMCWVQALLGGLLFVAGFPPIGWWWGLPLGLALLADALGADEFCPWMIFVLGTFLYLLLFAWMRHVTLAGWLGLSMISGGLWTLVFASWRSFKSPLIVAGGWVLLEQVRQALGWGWLPVASAMTGAPHPRMVAALGGETLLGFLVVWLGFVIALVAQEKNLFKSHWLYRGVVMVVLWLVLGGMVAREPLHANKSLRLGFVQPVAQTKLEKTSEELAEDMSALQLLTKQVAYKGNCDVILWPEQVTPWPVNTDASMRLWVESAAKWTGKPILAGVLWREGEKYYNAVTLLDPQAGVTDKFYAKRRLVPFGEYIPFAELGWMRSLTPVVDSFTAGDREQIFEIGGVKFWPLVCYEDTFSALSDGAAAQADAIFVATNDGWFGREGAQAQHVSHDILRAIESGRPVVRVANDGLSGIADARGYFTPIAEGAFDEATEEVELCAGGAPTPYSSCPGLWRWSFPALMVGLGWLGVFLASRRALSHRQVN